MIKGWDGVKEVTGSICNVDKKRKNKITYQKKKVALLLTLLLAWQYIAKFVILCLHNSDLLEQRYTIFCGDITLSI